MKGKRKRTLVPCTLTSEPSANRP